MPYFDNCGAKLYYEEDGGGEVLIFLHGASLDMRQWGRQVQHFSQFYRVVTLDARGHGKSSLPLGQVSPDVFALDVKALMDYLKIEKATICGLSMGGHVAVQMAIIAPERVNALILIGTPCSNQFNLYERIVVPINRFCMKLTPMSLLAWGMCFMLKNQNIQGKAYIKDVVGKLDKTSFNRVWDAVTRMESRQGVSKIKCPTLILIGEDDSLTMPQQQFIHKSIEGSQLITIANAAHCANLDNPEQIRQEIETFLRKEALCKTPPLDTKYSKI